MKILSRFGNGSVVLTEAQLRKLRDGESIADADKSVIDATVGLMAMELLHLREQVTQLQGNASAIVLAQPHRCVRDFHNVIDQPVRAKPQRIEPTELRLRVNLIGEEFCELLSAIGCSTYQLHQEIRFMTYSATNFLQKEAMTFDFPEFVDALADLTYVIEGSYAVHGVDGRRVFAIVHEANMKKIGGPIDESGKRGKPSGWQPPDVAGELRAQGWDGA